MRAFPYAAALLALWSASATADQAVAPAIHRLTRAAHRARALLTPGRIAHIVQTFPAPPRDHADAVPFRLLSIATGELSSARLERDLRQQHEQTYAIRSHYDARREDGTFSLETEVSAESVGETLTQIDATLAGLRTAPIRERELTRAKLHARERIAIALESAEGTAALMSALIVETLRLPDDPRALLERELARIDATRAEDVQRVARTYLSPDARGVTVSGPLIEYAPVLEDWCGGDYDIYVPKRLTDRIR